MSEVVELLERLRGDIDAARSTGIGQWADLFATRIDELEAALAAHDQKVREQVLEEATKAAAWTPKDSGIIVGKEWYEGYEAGCKDAETRVRALASRAEEKP